MQCIGMDLGATNSTIVVLTEDGDVEAEATIRTTRAGVRRFFANLPRFLVVLEASGCSPWVSRLLEELGHDVMVLNPRRAKIIAESTLKTDRIDAEILARLGRIALLDPKLLSRVDHRSEATQMGRNVCGMRSTLVECRTKLINTARGMARSLGYPLPRASTNVLPERVEASTNVPEEVKQLLTPLLETIAYVSEQIAQLENQIKALAQDYPVVEQLTTIPGVGVLTALSFVLCIEDPDRFRSSRDVGPFLGLRPSKRDSGNTKRRGRITREGDSEMRRLLTQAAHSMTRAKAPSDLKAWMEQLEKRMDRKCAITALSRKLAVLMHHLWVSGEIYDPCHASRRRQAKQQQHQAKQQQQQAKQQHQA